MNVESYLKRINYTGSRAIMPETLRQLQLAHLQMVPFENLSIHAGQPIVLNDKALFEKIVERRRGGFCYELNGLFAGLLRELGFDVQMLSAEVASSASDFGPDFDHMALLVQMDERWLADVGFGDSFNEPLLLDSREVQAQGAGHFQILEDEAKFILLREHEGEWNNQYRFTLRPYNYTDYQEMCRFQETSPESHFTKGRMCSLVRSNGRITLSELKLITTIDGKKEERILTSEQEFSSLLASEFGISERLNFRIDRV